MHLWYADRFGTPAPPFRDCADAIDSFAAVCCSVGVSVQDGRLRVYADRAADRGERVDGLRAVAERRCRHTARAYQTCYACLVADLHRYREDRANSSSPARMTASSDPAKCPRRSRRHGVHGSAPCRVPPRACERWGAGGPSTVAGTAVGARCSSRNCVAAARTVGGSRRGRQQGGDQQDDGDGDLGACAPWCQSARQTLQAPPTPGRAAEAEVHAATRPLVEGTSVTRSIATPRPAAPGPAP